MDLQIEIMSACKSDESILKVVVSGDPMTDQRGEESSIRALACTNVFWLVTVGSIHVGGVVDALYICLVLVVAEYVHCGGAYYLCGLCFLQVKVNDIRKKNFLAAAG